MGSQDPGEGEINTDSGSNSNSNSTWPEGTEEPVAAAVAAAVADTAEEEEEEEEKEVKVVQWEDFHDPFVHLGGVAVNLSKLRAKKSALSEKLKAAIQISTRTAERVDTLEALRSRLRERCRSLDRAKASRQSLSEQLARTKESLMPSAQGLFLSAKALAAAQGRVKEADKLLAGEGGHGRLLQLRKLLDARRREMVAQVASLYPLGTVTALQGTASDQKSNVPTSSQVPQSGGETAQGAVDELSMAIAGLQLVVPVKKQPGHKFLGEKSDYEASATALGYVAQVVSLVASYLDVPLRYPVRLGASRSYIQDHCPATEPATVDSGPIALPPTTKQTVEFPLFSEGQEQTRSAYGIFLLNKDLEQILNRLGVESVGPRHTLSNLNRVINTVSGGRHQLA